MAVSLLLFIKRILLVFTVSSLSKLRESIFLTSPEGSFLILHAKAHFISFHERASDVLVQMCTEQDVSGEAKI